jgi:hypothetical protein
MGRVRQSEVTTHGVTEDATGSARKRARGAERDETYKKWFVVVWRTRAWVRRVSVRCKYLRNLELCCELDDGKGRRRKEAEGQAGRGRYRRPSSASCVIGITSHSDKTSLFLTI